MPHIKRKRILRGTLFGITLFLLLMRCHADQKIGKPNSPGDSRYLTPPADPDLPTLFLIGDSTVRNGNGTGKGGQWGWGDFLAPYFDVTRINVVNHALGGTSSRTFYRDRWPLVKSMMKPGDFVIMQFGHNDSSPINEEIADKSARSRGTIDGIGPETRAITNILTGRLELVHSFGWYETQMISEARAIGATPIVCSLIPRNKWENGRAVRDKNTYAGWAGQAALAANAPFLDINEIIASQYDRMGEEKVQGLFIAGAGPHTSEAGAQINAACVIAALKGLPENPLSSYFSAAADTIAPAALHQPATATHEEE